MGVEQGAAKVIANAKKDWVLILGVVLVLLLLFLTIVFALSSVGILSLVMLAIAVAVSAIIWNRLVESLFWSNPEAHFSSWPLTLGSRTQVTYVQRQRRGTSKDRSINGRAAVTCTESATYTVGSSSRTDTATAFGNKFGVDGQFANGEIRVPITVSIPIHAGAPSMIQKHNEITWDLSACMKGATGRERRSLFRLLVAAALTDQVDSGV